jgi:TRAP-type mannitol/chloroaromatic compound transport system substrate-binding protein
MNLKKIVTATAAAAVLGTGALAWTAPAQAEDKKVRWKLSSTYSSGLTQLGTLGVQLSKNIGLVSGGNIQMKFFEPKALVPELENFDAVAAGSVDAAWSTPGYWRSKEEAFALFAAVPFGPSAGEYLAWMYHGGGHDLMDEVYAKYGLKSLLCGVIAPEASGWFRSEIKSVEDLKGLKMRFFGLGAKVMEKLGVSTQLLAGGDIYPALERGTIDATEFSMPAIDLKLGFYQVAKHYYFPGWHQQSTLFELLMNKEKWDALSDTQKAQLTSVCKANITDGLAEGEAIQSQALIDLKAKGVNVHRWPQEILDTLEQNWNEVAGELAANDPTFKKVWDSLQAFRADYKVWKELGYLN